MHKQRCFHLTPIGPDRILVHLEGRTPKKKPLKMVGVMKHERWNLDVNNNTAWGYASD